MIKKLDPDKVPASVKEAYAAAELWLAERCKGRRIQPKPVVVSLPIPEEGEEAQLYAVLVPPSGTSQERIAAAQLRVSKAPDTGAALQDVMGVVLAECCLWVEGMPASDKSDPRVVARNFLREMKEERGSLGSAFAAIATAGLEMLATPEPSLGKL